MPEASSELKHRRPPTTTASSSSSSSPESKRDGGRRPGGSKKKSSSFAAALTYLTAISIVALLTAARLVAKSRRDRDRLRGRRDDNAEAGGAATTKKAPKTTSKVFIGIKTDSSGVHGACAREIRSTWLNDVVRLENVDAKFFEGKTATGGADNDVVRTDCEDGYGGSSVREGSDDLGYNLCCKNGAMYQHFLDLYYGKGGKEGGGAEATWFCSFDDDNYVLVENLLRVLSTYETHKPQPHDSNDGRMEARNVYVGRPSVPGGKIIPHLNNITVEFLTGGAGYCLSSDVVLRGRTDFVLFEAFCRRYRLPDDVAIGHLVSNVLGVNVTTNELFHSHYETHTRNGMDLNDVEKQVSFGYDNKMKRGEGGTLKSFPKVPVLYSTEEDPMLFRSLRSFLMSRDDDEERSTLGRWWWHAKCRAKDVWYRVLRPKIVA